jgi:Na+-transporting NADH:ubiquinone oxidoreductase subunit NqrD
MSSRNLVIILLITGACLAGAVLINLLGAILLPLAIALVTAVLKVFVRSLKESYLQSRFYQGEHKL